MAIALFDRALIDSALEAITDSEVAEVAAYCGWLKVVSVGQASGRSPR